MSETHEIEAAPVGAPRALDPDEHPCLCVQEHRPALRATHRHHVVPLAWGGPDTEANVVPLCPSGHDVVHGLHRAWTRAGERAAGPGRGNRFLFEVAARGWDGRPA